MSLTKKCICLWSIWCIIFMDKCMMKVFSLRSQLVQVNSCTLLDQEAIAYECTVCGEGATLWTGSLFDCASNNIVLSHRLFEDEPGTRRECNNGAVTAHSIGVFRENVTDCYISQLNISMITADINNRTVTCEHVFGANESIVDTVSIGYISVMVTSPDNIRVIDVKPKRLTFTWNDSENLQQTHSLSDTNSIVYNIIVSNCGTCPNSTTSLSATCVDFIADGRVCSFALQAVVCRNRFGPISDSVKTVIKALDASVVDAKHLVLSSSSSFIYSLFNESKPIKISNEINGSALSYSISYYDSTSNILCGSAIILPTSCINGTCRHVFDVTLSPCIMGTKFILTVMATNVFGDGPVSNYSVSEKISCFISGETVQLSTNLQTWIASLSSLGSLLLLTLTLSIVLSIVTVVSIRSKKRMARETQQIRRDSADQAGAKVIYEEVELSQHPTPPSVIQVIHTEENIAYANISRNNN